MSSQQLLMPIKQEPDAEPPVKDSCPSKQRPSTDSDSFTKLPSKKYGHDQLPPEDEGYWYIELDLYEKRQLDGTSQFMYDMSSGCHNPLDMLGGHFGFSGGADSNAPIKEHFDSWMEEKKHDADDLYWPFTKEQTKIEAGRYRYLYYEFRVLPLSNYFIIIPDKMIDLLMQEGFDFETWYQEFKAIQENRASQKDFDRAMRIMKLIDEGEKLSIESRPLIELNYKLDKLNIEGDVFGLFHRDDLTKKMHDIGLTLYKIDLQIIKLRKTLRTRRYMFTGDIRTPREFSMKTDDLGITCENGTVLMPNIEVRP